MPSLAHRPPPVLNVVLNCLDPGDGRNTMVIASDLLERNYPTIGRDQLIECDKFLEQLLSDDATSNADLKGMLNRLTAKGAWGIETDFGGGAKSARRFLEALRVALSRKIT